MKSKVDMVLTMPRADDDGVWSEEKKESGDRAPEAGVCDLQFHP